MEYTLNERAMRIMHIVRSIRTELSKDEQVYVAASCLTDMMTAAELVNVSRPQREQLVAAHYEP